MASPLYILLTFLFIAVHVTARHSSSVSYALKDPLSEDQQVSSLFAEWVNKFEKSYKDDIVEKQNRYEIFKRNFQYIQERNNLQSSYVLGLNRFADLTSDEFKARYFGRMTGAAPRLVNNLTSPSCKTSELPPRFDWRQKGAVTPIKDQGQCGSCWAFSAVGAIEGVHAISTGNLISLSEQEIMSCDTTDYGCSGGYEDDGFEWVIKNGGISSEEYYPYTSGVDGSDAPCDTTKIGKQKVATISNYVDVATDDESALLCAVAQQPVSVAINADSSDFMLYSGGVFTGRNCLDSPEDLDHAVVIVGWGSTDGEDYWIVKNSWGESWGLEGYVYMIRNTKNKRGVCGINLSPSYPIA